MHHSPVEPHLWTADLGRFAAFWCDVLGFETAQRFPAEGEATWMQLRLGGATFMVSLRADPSAAPDDGRRALREELVRRTGSAGEVVYYVRVPDVDAAHHRVRAVGAPVLEELWDAWWGYREFTVADPEGHLVCLFTPIDGD